MARTYARPGDTPAVHHRTVRRRELGVNPIMDDPIPNEDRYVPPVKMLPPPARKRSVEDVVARSARRSANPPLVQRTK